MVHTRFSDFLEKILYFAHWLVNPTGSDDLLNGLVSRKRGGGITFCRFLGGRAAVQTPDGVDEPPRVCLDVLSTRVDASVARLHYERRPLTMTTDSGGLVACSPVP